MYIGSAGQNVANPGLTQRLISRRLANQNRHFLRVSALQTVETH